MGRGVGVGGGNLTKLRRAELFCWGGVVREGKQILPKKLVTALQLVNGGKQTNEKSHLRKSHSLRVCVSERTSQPMPTHSPEFQRSHSNGPSVGKGISQPPRTK